MNTPNQTPLLSFGSFDDPGRFANHIKFTIIMENTATFSTFLEWARANGVTSVHKVLRENSNNYLYVTCLKGSGPNCGDNVYLSKAMSVGKEVGDSTNFLRTAMVSQYTRADGAEMTKISSKGEGKYVSLEDMFA